MNENNLNNTKGQTCENDAPPQLCSTERSKHGGAHAPPSHRCEFNRCADDRKLAYAQNLQRHCGRIPCVRRIDLSGREQNRFGLVW